MKIAYFSVYRDGTGYSQAALDNILCMESAGLDVVCRPIRLSNPGKSISSCKVEHLEKKSLNDIDVIIQHCLPHFFERKNGVKNIGIFDWETSDFKKSIWAEKLNDMDEIWVPCIQNKYAAINSGVIKPIKIVNHSCDLKRYEQKKEKIKIEILNGKCVFYFIGEFVRRKNVAGLIRAYYAAFSSNDNVSLVIKTSIPGMSPEKSCEAVKKMISDIRSATHIHADNKNYPPVVVITEKLSEEQLNNLHASCDIFVSASHGEGGNLGAMDAMGFGNPVILTNWGFHPELCYEQAESYWKPDKEMFIHPGDVNCGWLIPGHLTYCFGMNGLSDLYTGSEKWFDPNMVEFSKILRNSYEVWKCGLSDMGKSARKRIESFSYDTIGKQIKNIIEGKL